MKNFLSILLILFLLICVIFLTYVVFNNDVKVLEFDVNENFYSSAEIDINRTGKKDKIELIGINTQNTDIAPTMLHLAQTYKLVINEQEFDITIPEGHHIISLGIADLNGDGKKEIMVCIGDLTISPSYRKWLVYSFDGSFLRFVEKIYDGHISYNYLTNKLTVIYRLHETRRPMYEFNQYKLDLTGQSNLKEEK